MIDFKSEILAKRIKEDKKVDLYNSVVNEYVGQIKDIFEYDNLKVDCQEVDGLIKITILSSDEKTKYVFSYSSIRKCLYINPTDTLADKSMIENKLKEFVLKIAENEDVRIKETPVRGLRAGKFIEESCNINKEDVEEVLNEFDKPNENNIYLTQKERNTIRCDIENTLHKFESEVDNTLRNNELQLAKINHNVVDTCRSILDKLQFADYECLENSKYYLTIDLDRQGENKAILFRQYEDKLKIDKFIDFYERDFTKIAQKLINEIKPYKNGKIIIPNVVFGQNLIDFIKAEGFEDIIELDLKDLNKCNIYNLELFNDKNKIYNLSDVNIRGNEYHTGFITLKKQLDNLAIKTNTEGSNSRFEIKDNDTDKYWIICVFFTLYKLGYKL